jgi:hypothetical protein
MPMFHWSPPSMDHVIYVVGRCEWNVSGVILAFPLAFFCDAVSKDRACRS